MPKVKDFLEDEDGDLMIKNGDLVIGYSDKQHIKDITVASIGWWKQFPMVGVGIMNYLNSSGKQQELERIARIQYTADGYTVGNPKVKYDPDGTLTIEPNAERL
jgi:hypothetical protein